MRQVKNLYKHIGIVLDKKDKVQGNFIKEMILKNNGYFFEKDLIQIVLNKLKENYTILNEDIAGDIIYYHIVQLAWINDNVSYLTSTSIVWVK